MALSPAERADRLIPFWEKAGMDAASRDREWLAKVVEVVGDRVKILPDVCAYSEFFFHDVEPDAKAEKLIAKAEPLTDVLKGCISKLEALEPFETEPIDALVRAEAEAAGVGVGKLIQPLRAAVMGRKVGPGLFESFALLGKEKVIASLRKFWSA